MNRLQEIKDEIAENKGYANWYCLLNGFRYHSDFSIDEVEKFENKAAEQYAKEMCEKQKKICADALQIRADYEHGDFLGIYNNILDTPNATEQQ